MNFNFNETANVSSSRQPLSGNKIWDVTFDGCEARDIQGVKDASQVYQVLDIKFSNNEGFFTHTIWAPKPGDELDTQGSFGPQPAPLKSMQLTIQHLANAVAPELLQKLSKLPAGTTWDQLRKFIVKETEASKGITTKIKLITNKKGEAAFPSFFAAYNRNSQLYMKTNFIGNNIFFTNKELENIKKQETAKPTNFSAIQEDSDDLPFGPASNEAPDYSSSSSSNFDIDLNEI